MDMLANFDSWLIYISYIHIHTVDYVMYNIAAVPVSY